MKQLLHLAGSQETVTESGRNLGTVTAFGKKPGTVTASGRKSGNS
jgi:hypothetical protein